MTDAQKITIDGVDHLVADLSDDAKGMVVNIKLVDQEMDRLRRQLLIHQTARQSFVSALQRALPGTETH